MSTQRTAPDQQMSIFPHKNDQRSERSAAVRWNGDRGPRVGPPIGGPPPGRTGPTGTRYQADTCPTCGHTTIAGLWKGLRVDLEPTVLTDLDEAHAIRDGVQTYNLHDPGTVMPRFLIAITSPTRHDRHAQHRCGTTYGTLPRTSPRTRTTPTTDEPPF